MSQLYCARKFALLLVVVIAFSVHQRVSFAAIDCDKLHEDLKMQAGGDPNQCANPTVEYSLKDCEMPDIAQHQRTPAQVILALDASGSMAGMVGGETKMAVARRETLAFMNALIEDVPVGLVIYGHQGNNQEDGKQASCEGIQWAHAVGAERTLMAQTIDKIMPVGWTPLADTLAFLEAQIVELPETDDAPANEDPEATPVEKVPVVYLISDGEETCDGDPVAAARSLHTSGMSAVVNVVGFDVDDATRAQLEAISDSGGGRFLLAQDGRELRLQLQKERQAQSARVDYARCTSANSYALWKAFNSAITDMQTCYQTQAYQQRYSPIMDAIGKFVSDDVPEKACFDAIGDAATAEFDTTEAAQETLYQSLHSQYTERKAKIDIP